MNHSNTGSLEGIAYRTAPRTPMLTTNCILVTPEAGISGDCRGKPGKRQVTVMSLEAWQQACAEIDRELPWTTRRANLLITGFTFSATDVGKRLRIGDVILEVTRETDPCSRMDDQAQGLRKALEPDWRGGVCTRVKQGGEIKLTDTVEWVQI